MRKGKTYSDEEANFLARLWAEGKTNDEAYEAYVARFGSDRSQAAIAAARTKTPKIREAVERWEEKLLMARVESRKEWVERALGGEHVPGIDVDVETVTPVKPPFLEPEELWERAERATRAASEWKTRRHYGTIRFMSESPIGISFASDQHINTTGAVALTQMKADAQLIAATPGLFSVLGGDGVDNHIKHRSAMVAGASSPADEYTLYDHYLGLLGKKAVAMISGNHDDWTKDFAGIDMVSHLASRRRIFFAPDYLVLRIEILSPRDPQGEPTQTYIIKIRHQYRYGSSFNKTHSIKRMWEMDEDDFDIGVLCHKHEVAMEPFVKHGRLRWAFRPGSYQVVTSHSRRYGYNRGEPYCPTAILWPDRRKIVGFVDVQDASGYLRYLRTFKPGEAPEELSSE